MKALSLFALTLLFALPTEDVEYSPYYFLGQKDGNISAVSTQIKTAANASGFQLIGSYAPGNQKDLYVLVFTNTNTKSITSKAKKQGVVAATYRVGLELKDSKVDITAVNPVYQWIAYLGEDYADVEKELSVESGKFNAFCKKIGNGKMTPFGGVEEEEDLIEYQYMFGMPYYEDQVELNEFASHAEGQKIIEGNLKNTESLKLVYKINDAKRDVTVYGVGLVDSKKGERHFLSIIGQKHVAAMPYELILDGKEAKMLHGRFRFALYWPELTMGTFTQIMSTPGDCEVMLEKLTTE
ncbi:MAG: hypothetical protein JXQ87_13535 [Bacteroidia bacterium]